MESTQALKALAEAFCNRIDECFTCFTWKGAQVLLEASPMDLGMKHDDVLVASPLVIDLCASDAKTGAHVEQTHERITLAVRHNSNTLCYIKMYKKKTQLKELVDAICQRKGWQNYTDVTFQTSCGSPINGLLTPEDCDMEDGDEILACVSNTSLGPQFNARLGVGRCCSDCGWDEWYNPFPTKLFLVMGLLPALLCWLQNGPAAALRTQSNMPLKLIIWPVLTWLLCVVPDI